MAGSQTSHYLDSSFGALPVFPTAGSSRATTAYDYKAWGSDASLDDPEAEFSRILDAACAQHTNDIATASLSWTYPLASASSTSAMVEHGYVVPETAKVGYPPLTAVGMPLQISNNGYTDIFRVYGSAFPTSPIIPTQPIARSRTQYPSHPQLTFDLPNPRHVFETLPLSNPGLHDVGLYMTSPPWPSRDQHTSSSLNLGFQDAPRSGSGRQRFSPYPLPSTPTHAELIYALQPALQHGASRSTAPWPSEPPSRTPQSGLGPASGSLGYRYVHPPATRSSIPQQRHTAQLAPAHGAHMHDDGRKTEADFTALASLGASGALQHPALSCLPGAGNHVALERGPANSPADAYLTMPPSSSYECDTSVRGSRITMGAVPAFNGPSTSPNALSDSCFADPASTSAFWQPYTAEGLFNCQWGDCQGLVLDETLPQPDKVNRIKAHLYGHVRETYPGSPTTDTNCGPATPDASADKPMLPQCLWCGPPGQWPNQKTSCRHSQRNASSKPANLVRHVMEAHMGLGQVRCAACAAVISRKVDLKRHREKCKAATAN